MTKTIIVKVWIIVYKKTTFIECLSLCKMLQSDT